MSNAVNNEFDDLRGSELSIALVTEIVKECLSQTVGYFFQLFKTVEKCVFIVSSTIMSNTGDKEFDDVRGRELSIALVTEIVK